MLGQRHRKLSRPLVVERLEERCLLACPYTLTVLAPISGSAPGSGARAINDDGGVAGASSTSPTSGMEAVYWPPDDYGTSPTQLNSSAQNPPYPWGIAWAISDDYVAGSFNRDLTDSSRSQAFVWPIEANPSGAYDVDPLDFGEFVKTSGTGVNDSAVVAGDGVTDDSKKHPARSDGGIGSGGVMELFLPNNPSGQSRAINENGWQVGRVTSGPPPDITPYVWNGTPGSTSPILLNDSSSNANNGTARAINDASTFQVAGNYVNPATGEEEAFSWLYGSNLNVTFLGRLGYATSRAEGNNNSGDVVGQVRESEDVAYAALWANGASSGVVLNDLDCTTEFGDWTLQEANDINNNGDIVGNMEDSMGVKRGFLLTEVSPTPIVPPPMPLESVVAEVTQTKVNEGVARHRTTSNNAMADAGTGAVEGTSQAIPRSARVLLHRAEAVGFESLDAMAQQAVGGFVR